MNAGAIDGKALITSPRLQPGVSISESPNLKRASAFIAITRKLLFFTPHPCPSPKGEGWESCALMRIY
jgi:hypothetical protein